MATPVGNAPDAINGKNTTMPAIPSTAVNGNAVNHDRNPSLTVTPSATFTANGGPVTGGKPSNIVFGQQYAGSSPAMTTPSLAHQSNNNLGVNQLNFRSASPQPGVPSPIPQPASVSGGRPPSSFQGNSGIHFGQQPGDTDTNGLVRPMANLHFGSQEHMRRGSSQSIHSDMGNSGLPTGPQRNNYPPQGGRGRGYQGFQPQMTYSPRQTFHPGPNGRGQQPNFHGQGRQSMPYQGSPSLAVRSPAMLPSNPGTPANQMHMVPGMQGQPNGYHSMGYPQVKDSFPSLPQPTRGKPGKKPRGAQRGGRGTIRGGNSQRFSRDPASEHFRPNLALMPNVELPHFYPDLSPESGNFEHFLTNIPQGFPMPTVADPSIQQAYQQQMFMHAQYPGYAPSSPRPQYQTSYPPQMQPTFSSQGHQPPSMSRQSSQMSVPDRPASSIGGTPSQTPSMSGAPIQSMQRAPSVSQPKPSIIQPPRKSAAIQIKNAAGEIVTFGKPPASPSVATPQAAAAAVPSTPTPPSRTESAVDKAEISTVKDDSAEEKRKAMQEAVAKKVAENEARLRKEKEDAEQKIQMEQEAVEATRRAAEEKEAEAKRSAQEAEQAKIEEAEQAKAREAEQAKAREAEQAKAQEAEQAKVREAEEAEAREAEQAKVQEEEAQKAAKTEPAPEDETAAPASEVKPTAKAADDELDLDALAAEMEREEAEREAEEARKEEEYMKKKAAQKAAELEREKEEQAAYEQNLKEEERKAEEAELAREKENAEGGSDEASKKMFAALKAGEALPSEDTDSPPAATPAESGTATPVSDISMPPPARGPGPKRGKIADLTLDIKKSVEPPEPSATLKSLTTARILDDLSKLSYPDGVASPNPALNDKAPASKGFKYDKDFLLQFRDVFKEKPSVDWDVKIREAMGDGEPGSSARASGGRTPSGMGGRSASNRPTPASGFTPMGTFGGPARTLPPNTTSEQRFAASNNQAPRGGMGANPFAQFSRGPPGTQMGGRTPSSNPMGSMPSPRVGAGPSRGGSRAESKRNKQSSKQTHEENKHMPLTAGMQLEEIKVTSSGWKPRSVGQNMNSGPALGGDGQMDPETVQRKVKSMLNKMTPDNFQRITDQILEIAGQSKNESDGRTLRQVIQLTFEKATDEAHWASMYAMFCRKTLESMSADIKDENIKDKNGNVVTGGNLFRKYLLNRCQEEFERGWKVNLPPKPEGQTEEAAMLSDEYYIAAAAKRRGLGLVKFIGELFKLQMLTERIMHECVKKLVDYEGTPDEAEVESLASLLRTIGRQLDDPESKAQPRMNVYFDRISATISNPELNSRLKFMLMDIVELRSKGWKGKDTDKGPKTIEQIHAEAEAAQQEKEMQRLAQQANRGGGGYGRLPMGRGDARQFGGPPPPDTTSRVGTDDLRKLGRGSTRNASNAAGPSLGPPSMMGARTNSNRRGLGPGGLMSRGADDSGSSSRNGTAPGQKKEEKKDESSTNAFSALAALESHDGPTSPPSNPASPPTSNAQPNIERERSKSPEKTDE